MDGELSFGGVQVLSCRAWENKFLMMFGILSALESSVEETEVRAAIECMEIRIEEAAFEQV